MFQVALNGFHSTKGGKKAILHLLLQIQLVSQEALQCQAMPQCKNEIADCYLPGKHFTALLASSMQISDFVWKVHCARGAIRFSSRGLNSFTEWPKFAPKSHYCWHLSWNVTKTFIFFLPLQLQTAPYFDTFLFQIHFFIIVVLGFLFGTTMYLVFL